MNRSKLILLFLAFFVYQNANAADAPLDKTLRPAEGADIPNVFRDMGVVQRRAMPKAGRFLLSTFGGFDFSDGPYTNYAFNMNPGYAINDFFEVYLNLAPTFIVSPRSIVDTVSQLQLAGGDRAQIVAARPMRQIGFDVLWAPAYGKDSLGLRTIIRSDTFLKLGYSKITYESDDGNKFQLGIGKTYFLTNYLGLRVCVNFGYLQTIVNAKKDYRTMALLDGGVVFYL